MSNDKKDKNLLNIFTTIDENWLPYACMLMVSIRNKYAGEINFWVVHSDISNENQVITKNWSSLININVEFIDFSRIESSIRIDLSMTEFGVWSKYPKCVFWGRYLGSWLLPKEVDHAIYMDVDMIAVDNLNPLANVALIDCTVGAVRCPSVDAASSINLRPENYFNNGLIVFDLSNFDAEQCIMKMRNALTNMNLRYGPQCAFSRAMNGSVFKLEDKFNVQGELRTSVGNSAMIVHFTGDLKPWHTLSADKLRFIVRDYIQATPFPWAWRPDTSVYKYYRLFGRKAKQYFLN